MIQIKNASKTIGNCKVLDNICIDIADGAVTGFQGINGSGKTMLMRMVAGLIRPGSGEVVIGGERLGKDMPMPPSMGLLIENPAFLDLYSGFVNLQMLASIKGCISNDEIRACIRRVGLDPDDKRRYRKYSLGMKQRLGIAAAVMERPDVVLLDEPTNALDEQGLEMLREVILGQKERGAAVVVASHDRDFLYSVADEIYLFKAGRVRKDDAYTLRKLRGEVHA